MARIKLAYLGGGSTRAPARWPRSWRTARDFDGSEVVLIDLDQDRLALVRTLAEKMARARGLDITVTATTDRRAASPTATPSSPATGRAASRRACSTSASRSSTA